MTRSEQMIREALRRSEARTGLKIKVRMSTQLKARATRCAQAVHEDLMDWVDRACRNMKTGKYDCVAWEPETQEATRDGSEAVWVRAPKGLNPAQVRLATACAVVYAERRNPPAFECPLVEGRDYLVETACER